MGWRLSRRITLLAGINCFLVILSAIWMTSRFLDTAVEKENLEHAQSQLLSMKLSFGFSDRSRADFSAIAQTLQDANTQAVLAWEVWDAEQNIWAEFGAPDLIDSSGKRTRSLGVSVDVGAGSYWATDTLTEELRMGILVLPARESRIAANFWVDFSSLGALILGLSALSAAMIGRHAGQHLSDVAESIRSIQDLDVDEDLPLYNLPLEIRNVVSALEEMLQNIRTERDRAMVMTAGLAHELRSPIQNLMGTTEVALLRTGDERRYRSVLESQVEELRGLARVVDNLVMLCTRKGTSEVVEEFDIGREAEIRLQREKSRAEQNSIEIEVKDTGDLGYLGDREAIMLALSNLVNNAVYWSPWSSKINVFLEGRPRQIVLTVDDSGPGVPMAERDTIFEPFFQGQQKSKGQRIGYGLGLALTREAVAAHNGLVSVDDSPLGGARFQIILPRRFSDDIFRGPEVISNPQDDATDSQESERSEAVA